MPRKTALEDIFATAAGRLLEKGASVVLGLSGGADSSVLFHLLVNSPLGFKVWPVHINHCLRGEESDGDERFCEGLARVYKTEIAVFRADIAGRAKETGRTVEEAGRDFRYGAFEEVRIRRGASAVAVAHTRNDNAETVIMRLFRGTGGRGLSGIPDRRGFVVRPLLRAGRGDIMEYCARHGLDYREDASNADNGYTRNWVRNRLIPMIEERINPGLVESVAQTSAILSEEEAFLDGAAKAAFGLCLIGDGILDADRLRSLDPAIKRRVVRLAFGRFAGGMRDFGMAHVDAVLGLLTGPAGKSVCLPAGSEAHMGYGTLEFCRGKGKNTPNIQKEARDFRYETDLTGGLTVPERGVRLLFRANGVPGEKDFKNGCTNGADYARMISKPYAVRNRLPGDRILMSGHHRELKYCLRNLGIPPEDRKGLFYLALGGDIKAVLSEKGMLAAADDFKDLGITVEIV